MSFTETTAARGPVPAALAALNRSVQDAAGALGFVADPSELAEVMADVVATRNRFDALIAQYARQLETSGAPRSIGVRTVAQLVAAQTNADAAPIRAAATRARWLRDFPMFEDAFTGGDLSGSHVDLMRRHLDGPRTHAMLLGDQEFFVDSARDCSFADFKKVAEYWLITIDPDGDEPAEQKDRTGLSVRVGRGGRVHITGELDAVSGQAFRTALDRAAQQLAIADRESGTIRSESRRRAAALVDLVTRGAARTDGTHPAPLINIVMSETMAEYLMNQLAEQTSEPVPVKWNDIDGRCELIDGTPIHPKHAIELFGIATFRRHIIGAQGRLTDVSVNARTFPTWMRNALHVQARGSCETPGCDAPHRWTQADHVQPHSRGGKTRLHDGQILCAPDNHAKTNTTGHRPWRNRKPPPRKHRTTNCSGDNKGEAHLPRLLKAPVNSRCQFGR